MKKLITMIGAAAAALGLYADAFTFTGSNFEQAGWSAGDSVIGVADDGTAGASFWTQGDDTESTAKIAAETTGLNGLIGEWAEEASDSNVVDIKTKLDKPVFRNVLTTGAGVAMSDCVFFDSLVKFTACDEPVAVSSFAGAKLAVWIHEDEENQKTNLFVTAGYFTDTENVTEPRNYDCGGISSYEIVPGEWCRLTIKTIADITNEDGVPGFAIFVNGNDGNATPVACTESKGVAGSAITKLNNACAARGVKYIFPSIDQASGDKAKVAGVGFAGQGSVDEVTFTASEDSRAFAADPEIQMFTINWADGDITALAINDEPVDIGGKLSYSYPLIGVTELTVTPTFAEDRKMVYDWDNATDCTASFENGTIRVTDFEAEGQPAIMIETMSSANGATVDGRTYPTIAEAVEYLNGLSGAQTLVIGDAVSATASTDNNITIDSETLESVTIDLHGETIYGADVENGGYHYGVIEIDSAIDVLITDSVGGGKVVAEESTEQPAVQNYSGDLTIEDGIFDGAVLVDTEEMIGTGLIGGKYLASANTDEDNKFTLDVYVDKDGDPAYEAKLVDEGAYWEVAEKVIVKHSFILMIGENEYSREEIEEGEEIDVPEAPKSGLKGWQTFTQWQYQNGTTFVKTTMGTEDITLYAGTEFLDQDSDDNYLVKTAGDLIKLQAYVADGQDTTGKTFLQTADIVWTDQDGTFPGIGTYSNNASTGANNPGFKGTYDGDGKAIRNIKVASAKYAGIFTQLYGTVQNLTVENVYVDWTPDYNTKLNDKGVNAFTNEVGGAMVVSHVWGGTVKNVTTKGAFGSTEAPLTGSAGGVVCRVTGNATIENCVNEAALYGAAAKIAGIMIICQAGSADEGVVIKNCENKGSINWVNKDNNDVAGGYAGIAAYVGNGKKVKIEGCTNSGAITCALAGADVGQIVGKIQSGSVVADGTFTVAADQLVIGNKALDGFNFATIEESAVTLVADAALAVGGSYKVMSPRKGASDANKATATIAFTEAEQTVSFDQSLATAKFAITSTTGVIETNDVDNIITFTAKAPASPWPTPDPKKDEPEAVAEAMEGAGFSEASAVAIGTKANYTAFQGYCTEKGIIPSEVGAAKDNAVLTFALGAEACSKEITSEDITIETYDQAAGKLTVKIDGVTAGETIRGDVLAKILTAKGGDELDGLDQNNVTVSGYAPADGEIEVTVAPDESFDNPTAFFYQIELKK